MSRKKKALPLLESVEIEGVAAEGKAICRVRMSPEAESEMVVFVPYAAPGDVADIQIDRRKRSYAEGHIVRIAVISRFAEAVNGSICHIRSNCNGSRGRWRMRLPGLPRWSCLR